MDQESDLTRKEPTEIRQEIEQTRSSLTDKLETLEHEVRDTVRNATQAVVETVETVKQTVEGTVDTVKEKVEGTVETVKHTFDPVYQVDQHPWLMVGGAAAAGFLVGSLLPREDWVSRSMSRSPGAGIHPVPAPGEMGLRTSEPAGVGYVPPERERLAGYTAPVTGLVSEIAQRFAPEIRQLKGLAIGAALGLVRDVVKESVPGGLSPKLENIIDSVTTKLGGQPVHGPITGEGERAPNPYAR